ncbi:uncharacterized protein Fot_34810 [Forsythia ovata]|uniref:Uncharacterized protein n=1 Tax=Forsythia ovata TaxID=205694 RepID=A0ABD1SMT2_9LAMI
MAAKPRSKVQPPPKRRKLDGPSSHRPIDSPSEKRDVFSTPVNKSSVAEGQTSSINISIRQARDSAVAQAQQDGCTGNFRIFDSPYGNYLVPVIPTLADLGE